MQQVVDRNAVRHHFLFFLYGVIALLNNNDQIRFNVLQQNLTKFQNQAVKKMKNGKKSKLKQLITNERNDILQYARDIRSGKSVDTKKLLWDIFDGVPITAKVPVQYDFDVIVEEAPDRLTAFVYCPTGNEVFDDLTIQVQAEQVYHQPCTKVKIENMINDVPKNVIKNTTTVTTPAVVTGNIDADVTIGKVLFSKKFPLLLSNQPEKDRVQAGIFERYSDTIFPNSYLRLVGEDKIIYCRVVAIKANPISGAGLEHSFSELSTLLTLQPIREKTETYSGRPRSTDLSKFVVKRLTPNELIEILHIPRKGLAIGVCDYEELDYDFLFPLEPDTSIYQSWTVAGIQGRGKSSFVKLLIMGLTSMEENHD